MIEGLPTKEELMNSINRTSDLCWKAPISSIKIEKWVDQFDGSSLGDVEEEQVLALLLLNNFVFYSQSEVRYLCKEIFDDFIHFFLDSNKLKTQNITDLSKDIIKKTIFTPVGNPSESSANLMYYFRQENNIPKDKFTYLGDLSYGGNNTGETKSEQKIDLKDIDNIVFIDDVTLSGTQIIRYISSQYKGNKSVFSNKNLFFLPLIASNVAIKKLNELKDFKIITLPGMELNHRDNCFSEGSYIFQNHKVAKEKCIKMLEHYNNKFNIDEEYLGYKKGDLALGFFYNTPNNTLPIFWFDSNCYTSIFTRNSKIFTDEYMGVNIDGIRKYF